MLIDTVEVGQQHRSPTNKLLEFHLRVDHPKHFKEFKQQTHLIDQLQTGGLGHKVVDSRGVGGQKWLVRQFAQFIQEHRNGPARGQNHPNMVETVRVAVKNCFGCLLKKGHRS